MTYQSDLSALGASADAQINSLTSQLATSQSALATAQSQAATLQNQLTASQAQTAAVQAQVASLQAQVADLKAQLAALQPVPPVPSTPALPAGWTKTVFADYFDGTAVDTTKWNVRNNTTQNNMDGRNFAANCTVKNGILSIKTGLTGDTAKPWSCGYLDTIGKSSFQFGRWEARMRFPWGSAATGFWPAFWLRPDDGGNGEIDIMEAWPAKTEVGFTLHHDYLTDATHVGQVAWRFPKPLTFDPTQWHTYAVEHEAGVMKFYLDDKLIWDASGTSWFKDTLDRNVKWNIRLNLQMGGSWGGKPTAATDLTKTFDIDFVRVLAR